MPGNKITSKSYPPGVELKAESVHTYRHASYEKVGTGPALVQSHFAFRSRLSGRHRGPELKPMPIAGVDQLPRHNLLLGDIKKKAKKKRVFRSARSSVVPLNHEHEYLTSYFAMKILKLIFSAAVLCTATLGVSSERLRAVDAVDAEFADVDFVGQRRLQSNKGGDSKNKSGSGSSAQETTTCNTWCKLKQSLAQTVIGLLLICLA